MKKCPRCGYEIKNDENFCPHCGLDLRNRYQAPQKKNKAMTYLLYVVLFFSFITIPLLYTRLLSGFLGQDQTVISEEKIALPDIKDKDATRLIAAYDTLEDFTNQFTNVDDVVKSIHQYEAALVEKGDYDYDKRYSIQIADNYNIYYDLIYTANISNQLSVKIHRRYDRSHQYNEETLTFSKKGATTFQQLFLTQEEKAIVQSLTGQQSVTDQLMDDFAKREAEFEEKKDTLGHYGIGNYQDQSSFVVYRYDQSYQSQLTYGYTPKEYIS